MHHQIAEPLPESGQTVRHNFPIPVCLGSFCVFCRHMLARLVCGQREARLPRCHGRAEFHARVRAVCRQRRQGLASTLAPTLLPLVTSRQSGRSTVPEWRQPRLQYRHPLVVQRHRFPGATPLNAITLSSCASGAEVFGLKKMSHIFISAATKKRASSVGWITTYRFRAISKKTKLTITYAYNSVGIAGQ